MTEEPRRALLASPTQAAKAAEERLRAAYEFVPVEQANMIIALVATGSCCKRFIPCWRTAGSCLCSG